MFTGTLGYEVFVCDPIPMNVSGTIINGGPDNRLTLEGHDLDVVETRHADTDDSASHKDKNLDDDAASVIWETRQCLDDADDQRTKISTPAGFFDATLEYAYTWDVAKNSVMGWFHPLLAGPFHMP